MGCLMGERTAPWDGSTLANYEFFYPDRLLVQIKVVYRWPMGGERTDIRQLCHLEIDGIMGLDAQEEAFV